MADIELSRSHSLGVDGGREAVARVAQKLEKNLSVDSHWENDTLQFEGHGAEGTIDVQADRVDVAIELSFMLRAMEGWIRSEAESYLDEHLANDGGSRVENGG
jgi:putative polyhydroxyalkanoate system protein